jgi:hypothetical protein
MLNPTTAAIDPALRAPFGSRRSRPLATSRPSDAYRAGDSHMWRFVTIHPNGRKADKGAHLGLAC